MLIFLHVGHLDQGMVMAQNFGLMIMRLIGRCAIPQALNAGLSLEELVWNFGSQS